MSDKEKIHLHHYWMGHPSFQIVKTILPSLFKNIDIRSMCCEVCELAKHRPLHFPINNKLSDQSFFLVHTDVWGPANIPTFSGAKWFLTFIDDYTRVTWIILLKHKSKISSMCINFVLMIKTQFGVTIKKIISDNAKDYFNITLIFFFVKKKVLFMSDIAVVRRSNYHYFSNFSIASL